MTCTPQTLRRRQWKRSARADRHQRRLDPQMPAPPALCAKRDEQSPEDEDYLESPLSITVAWAHLSEKTPTPLHRNSQARTQHRDLQISPTRTRTGNRLQSSTMKNERNQKFSNSAPDTLSRKRSLSAQCSACGVKTGRLAQNKTPHARSGLASRTGQLQSRYSAGAKFALTSQPCSAFLSLAKRARSANEDEARVDVALLDSGTDLLVPPPHTRNHGSRRTIG